MVVSPKTVASLLTDDNRRRRREKRSANSDQQRSVSRGGSAHSKGLHLLTVSCELMYDGSPLTVVNVANLVNNAISVHSPFWCSSCL
jgi:hypothetical protein